MPTMELNLRGKNILVTGAGRGIGRGIAIALAELGCHVFALSRTRSTLDTLVVEYPSIIPITLDLSDWNSARTELEKLDAMDGLVNNAGIIPNVTPCTEWTKTEIDATIDTNLMSVINCIQVIGTKMVNENKNGSIVNMSSVGGVKACAGGLAYNMTKAGIDMVTKQYALELGPRNIRVNTVTPTVVRTDMVQQVIDMGVPIDENIRRLTPMDRCATVQEVVDPVLYLLSDKSSMVNGTSQVIDGGLLSSIMV